MKDDNMRPVISPRLTPELLAESLRIAQMPDEDIDFSDIPRSGKDDWKNAARGKFFRPNKKQVTLRLDADLIDWFKAKQGGARGYQTAINAALRGVVEGARRKVE
jgi:uncharacterized protein (DUF4415 family)